MDPKQVTRESIAAEHPAIAATFTKEGHDAGYKAGLEAGTKQERERIQGVESQSIPGHETLIQTLKFDGKTTGPEAAVQVLQAERAARGNALNTMRTEAPPPVKPSADQPAKPSNANDQRSIETRTKEAWDADPQLRADFGDNFDRYFAYQKANENGQVRVFNPGAARK